MDLVQGVYSGVCIVDLGAPQFFYDSGEEGDLTIVFRPPGGGGHFRLSKKNQAISFLKPVTRFLPPPGHQSLWPLRQKWPEIKNWPEIFGETQVSFLSSPQFFSVKNRGCT